MAQQPGLGNTAPMPIPGGYGNPAGANVTGTPSATPGAIPQAYGPTPGAIPTTAGPGGFAANTAGAAATGTTASPGLDSLSSGSGANPDLLKQLQNDYGKGAGQAIYDMLSKGMFNPQVAKALIAAMQPQIERGLASTEAAFGAEGARFSSSAQIGVGDYESQAVLGENQVLANMYLQDQTMQLNLLENILPTIHQEQADSQSGLMGTLWQQFDWAEQTSPGPPGSSKGGGGAMPAAPGTAPVPSSGASAIQLPGGSFQGGPQAIQSGTSGYYNDQYLQDLLSSSAASEVGGVSSTPTGDAPAYPGFSA